RAFQQLWPRPRREWASPAVREGSARRRRIAAGAWHVAPRPRRVCVLSFVPRPRALQPPDLLLLSALARAEFPALARMRPVHLLRYRCPIPGALGSVSVHRCCSARALIEVPLAFLFGLSSRAIEAPPSADMPSRAPCAPQFAARPG